MMRFLTTAFIPLALAIPSDDDPFFGSASGTTRSGAKSAIIPSSDHAAAMVQTTVAADSEGAVEKSMYKEENLAAWNYDLSSDKGPNYWSKLNMKFARCTMGTSQSPIELFQFRIASPLTPAVTPVYASTPLTVRNTGNYLRLIPTSGSVLYYGDKTYDLQYISVHTPGEHAVGGEDFPLEIQFVHRAESGEVSILSVLYKQGLASDFLEEVITVAPSNAGSQSATSELDLQAAIPKDITQYAQGSRIGFPHYTYEGSLSTPPCTENVQWFVCSKPGFASKRQIDQLTKMFPAGSARPASKPNGRAVEFKTLF